MWLRYGFIVFLVVSLCAFGCDGPEEHYPSIVQVNQAFQQRDEVIKQLMERIVALEEKEKVKKEK